MGGLGLLLLLLVEAGREDAPGSADRASFHLTSIIEPDLQSFALVRVLPVFGRAVNIFTEKGVGLAQEVVGIELRLAELVEHRVEAANVGVSVARSPLCELVL